MAVKISFCSLKYKKNPTLDNSLVLAYQDMHINVPVGRKCVCDMPSLIQ
jgi:hypothetical protein